MLKSLAMLLPSCGAGAASYSHILVSVSQELLVQKFSWGSKFAKDLNLRDNPQPQRELPHSGSWICIL